MTRDLGELRDHIDQIDAAIVALLAQRMDVCREVAEVKATSSTSVIQPSRVREVLTSRRQLAINAGLDADFAEQIFRTVLAETHRIEVAHDHPTTPPTKVADTLLSALDTVAVRIDHVVVAVADLTTARTFATTLGFSVKETEDADIVTADAGHHRLVVTELDGVTVRRLIGTGERGLIDGAADVAAFSEPNGLCVLPADVADKCGYDILVADTVNHALRGVVLATGQVVTVAGTGEQWMQGDGPAFGASVPAEFTRLSSPWDVVWFPAVNAVVVAMAGIHQLWTFDPVSRSVAVFAGTTNEGMVDGDVESAWFAQTSGLAVSADDQTLWMADSETSSLRRVTNSVVHSEIGKGLFDFGFVDGAAGEALLQHPLGVAVLPDGSVAIADTYNNAVRRFDPLTREVSTIARDLREPSGIVVVATGDGAELLVTESAAHALTRIALPDKLQHVAGDAYRTQRPAQSLRPGALDLSVIFVPPSGQKLDDRYGPSTHLVVSSSPPELLAGGAGAGPDLQRPLVLADLRAAGVERGVLHVSVRAASCDIADEVEFPACHVHQQDWGVPVVLSDAGESSLSLMLAGLA